MGNVFSIAMNLISNRQEILQTLNKITPIVKQITAAYPDVHNLLKQIAPEMVQPSKSQQTSSSQSQDAFSVQWLQESLNTLSGAGLEVDGDYGEMTRAAVADFQKQHGLTADGWAGMDTSASVYNELAKRG